MWTPMAPKSCAKSVVRHLGVPPWTLNADTSGLTVGTYQVLEENVIVSEITFGEAGSGAAIVQGSYVGADQTRARAPAGYRGRGGGQESREQTLANGRRGIDKLAYALRLPERLSDAALRYFNLAVNMNFTRGRRTMYVVAACLYCACRMDKTHHMLIDFSDPLEINVFVLGATYLKLVRELSLQLPTVDPSLYISRFASMLDFGEETQKVAQDAVRLVSRMGRDWMHIGRRPAGICGACLLLAARMNNFRRTIPEIVQVVKIADQTLRKRLKEFSATHSSDLTVSDFRTLWLDDTHDPPSYTKAREDEKTKEQKGPVVKRKPRKFGTSAAAKNAKAGEPNAIEEQEDENESQAEDDAPEHAADLDRGHLDALAEAASAAQDASTRDRESMPPPPVPSAKKLGKRKQRSLFDDDFEDEPEMDEAEEGDANDDEHLDDPALDDAIRDVVNETLEGVDGQALTHELDEAEAKRRKEIAARNVIYNAQPLDTSDRLDDLDEDELDAFILAPDEVEAKSRLWMEVNKEYLKELAGEFVSFNKQTGPDGELKPITARRPRKKIKARDSSTPQGVSAADATKQLLTKKRFSKKINYSAIEDLFGRDSAASSMAGSDDENDDPASARSRRSVSVASTVAREAIAIPRPTFGNRSSRASSVARSSAPPTPQARSKQIPSAHDNDDEEEEEEDEDEDDSAMPEWKRMLASQQVEEEYDDDY
ncbi:transcription factor TFIIIB subunit brf1 [Microbotryomycetes sp. JL221]|nr:transcription factor TFIIIB subunit brf1 [Microbotryomycetes sp. JL221]